jgi:hypothetical protein
MAAARFSGPAAHPIERKPDYLIRSLAFLLSFEHSTFNPFNIYHSTFIIQPIHRPTLNCQHSVHSSVDTLYFHHSTLIIQHSIHSTHNIQHSKIGYMPENA